MNEQEYIDDQIKKNLEVKEIIENDPDNPRKLRDVKPSLLASLFNVYGGRCISCNGYVSEPNLSFVNYDVKTVLCYRCQGKLHSKANGEPKG